MKLLRSTFIAFYLTSQNASAFAPQISQSLSNRNQFSITPAISQSTTTSLFVGIHDQPVSQISDEEIRREEMFVEVRKEVNLAKDYLDFLIEESGDGAVSSEEATPAAAEGDAPVVAAAAGDVELFGGGGDVPAETPKETQYQPALRSDLGSTILLSGTADSNLLNILNNNFFGQDLVPNFEFGIIKALVEDVAIAKKRAISREARYGGLLDKLVIEPASSGGMLPTKEELAGVSSWIVEVEAGESSSLLPQVAELAKGSAELNNVIVMVSGSTSSTVEGWDAVAEASSNGEAFKATLLAVGELYDGGKEGGFYHIGPLGDEATPTMDSPKLSRKKAYQLLAHALALDCTANAALKAYEYPTASLEAIATPYAEGEFVVRDDEGNELTDEYKDVKMQSRMIQAMREVGFTPVVELDVLVDKGIDGLKEYIANPPNKVSTFKREKTAADIQDEKIMAMLEEESAKEEAIAQKRAAARKKIDVEGIAKEWATKEYTLRMLNGDIDDSMSEKDFMISVWDEAMTEGEKAWDRIHSEEWSEAKKRKKKAQVDVSEKLFWDGMPDDVRMKREKMVEKVKKQYMDLLSEEELEKIVMSDA